MVKVKFCGLTQIKDIDVAIEAGVDAVGFVFVKKSVRYITATDAKPLIEKAKAAGLLTVALFADQDAEEVKSVLSQSQADIIQFHGNETETFCLQFGKPYWKAIPMLQNTDWKNYLKQYPSASALLLDAYDKTHSGGSGQSFSWFKFPVNEKSRWILAGGLSEQNIQQALEATHAEFVDVSSGIEQLAGVKSEEKMLAFVKQLKNYNNIN